MLMFHRLRKNHLISSDTKIYLKNEESSIYLGKTVDQSKIYPWSRTHAHMRIVEQITDHFEITGSMYKEFGK